MFHPTAADHINQPTKQRHRTNTADPLLHKPTPAHTRTLEDSGGRRVAPFFPPFFLLVRSIVPHQSNTAKRCMQGKQYCRLWKGKVEVASLANICGERCWTDLPANRKWKRWRCEMCWRSSKGGKARADRGVRLQSRELSISWVSVWLALTVARQKLSWHPFNNDQEDYIGHIVVKPEWITLVSLFPKISELHSFCVWRPSCYCELDNTVRRKCVLMRFNWLHSINLIECLCSAII